MNELQEVKMALFRIENKIDHLALPTKATNHDSSSKEVVLLSIEEVAKMLRVAHRTVYGWIQQDKIPYLKINGRLLFNQEDVYDLLKATKKKSC